VKNEWFNKWGNFTYGVLIGWTGCNLVYLVRYDASAISIGGAALAFAGFISAFGLLKYQAIQKG
jgi:hypothetical protein